MVAPIDELRRLGALWTSWGGLYGGDQDPIHFQLTPMMEFRAPPAA